MGKYNPYRSIIQVLLPPNSCDVRIPTPWWGSAWRRVGSRLGKAVQVTVYEN